MEVQAGGRARSHSSPGHCSNPSSPSKVSAAPEKGGWRTHRRDVAARALFAPPPFRPEKLTVNYQDNSNVRAQAQSSRRYTLTHNDLTGELQLSVGSDYNYPQISGLYTRLLRDEIVAEWHFDPSPSLHIYCHVSGEEKWLAPPALRNYIFRRELPLVLDTFLWADQQLLNEYPNLAQAEVYVHFQSCQQELHRVELWGVLGQRNTWQTVPAGLVQRLINAVMSFGGARQEQPQQQRQSDLQVPMPEAPPLRLAAERSNGWAEGNILPSKALLDAGAQVKVLQAKAPSGNGSVLHASAAVPAMSEDSSNSLHKTTKIGVGHGPRAGSGDGRVRMDPSTGGRVVDGWSEEGGSSAGRLVPTAREWESAATALPLQPVKVAMQPVSPRRPVYARSRR